MGHLLPLLSKLHSKPMYPKDPVPSGPQGTMNITVSAEPVELREKSQEFRAWPVKGSEDHGDSEEGHLKKQI